VQPVDRRTVAVAEDGDRVGDRTARLVALLGQTPLEHPGALFEHEVGVDVGLDLDGRVVDPGAPRVRPALDAVGPPSRPVGGDRRAPPAESGVVEVHREVVVDAVGIGEHRGGVHGVVALAEDLGGENKLLVLHGLRGPSAPVDERSDVLDGDPPERQNPLGERLFKQVQWNGGGLGTGRRADALGTSQVGIRGVGLDRFGLRRTVDVAAVPRGDRTGTRGG